MTAKRNIPEKKRGPSVKKRYEVKSNGKNATGVPTEYTPDMCEKLIQFFTREPSELISAGLTAKLVPNKLPTFARFAFENKTTAATLLNWCKDYPEFFEAYNTCKELQKEFLTNNGLAGLYPPAAFIFVAKNITDMRDKAEIEHSGSIGGEISDDELIKRVNGILNKRSEN